MGSDTTCYSHRKAGDASVFHVWGSRAFVRDTSADKLSSHAVPCVFLEFPLDAPGWQFYHPTLRRVLSSRTSHLTSRYLTTVSFPTALPLSPPPPLFLAPGAPPVDHLPPQRPAPSGVSQVDPVENVEVAVDSGSARGSEPTVAESEGAEPGGAEPERVEPSGAEPWGAESRGAEPRGAEPERAESGGPPGVPSRREPFSLQRLPRAAGGAAGAGAAGSVGPGGAGAGGTIAVGGPTGLGPAGGAGAAGPGDARTGGTGAAGAGGAAGVEAVGARAVATGGAAGARAAGGTGAGGAAGVVARDPRAEGTGIVSTISGGAAWPLPYYVPLLQQVLGLPPSTGPTLPLLSPPLVQSLSQLQPASPLPGPSPYSGLTRGLTERREPESRPASPESLRASPESRPESPVRAIRTGRRRIPLPSPRASSLPDGSDPESDSLRAASPTVLWAASYASWVDELATQPSSQGYTFSLGSGSVSWRSTRLSSVLGSICVAEIYAGAMAAQELRWLTYQLTDLGEAPHSPPVLYIDNKARTKHIALLYFLDRELQKRGQLRLAYSATRANTADIFTKALQPCDHQPCFAFLDRSCDLLFPTCTHLLASSVIPSFTILTCVPLLSPLDSSLPAVPDPVFARARATSPTVPRLLAFAVTDPCFESAVASALVAELLDFAAACCLDYATALVAESASACPPSIGGECALSTDDLEDKQEDFECLAAAVPRFASMLLAPEGEPYAPDIPTPCSYAEAITGPYSFEWQAAMDAEMASLKSTGTYVDEVLPPGANIVDGMWIFRVKRPPGSPPAFKHCFLVGQPARGDLAAPPTWLHWVVSCRTTLAALWFSPSTADPSLFLRTNTLLPPFYVLVYIDDLVFATTDTKALTIVKARRTITLTQSHMVHKVLQRFGFRFSSPQPTPLSTGHSLSAPPSDESVKPSGLYPELVGCLMYLMMYARPNLAYPLSLLARYVAPGRHRKVHWDAAKRVLRYLCTTSGMGLVLGGRGPVVLTGHADASWVDDSATQRSSQGYTFSLGSGSISWRSTRSSSVLSSSCEAEIYTGAMAA
ncbi:unnamed protein product [Closterium sp. NIES-53]